jgi:hypothetical protein
MYKMKVKRWLLMLLFSFTALADTPIPKSIEPFFNKYCYSCHDADTEKGDLNLQGLTRKITNVTDAEHWQDILDNINAGEMPPKKKKQPSKAELSKAISDLTETLYAAKNKLKDSGGKIAVRRINKREYAATAKALMGINLDTSKLPDDPSGRFDTIGQNQSLNAIELEKYFNFAQEASRMALHWATQKRQKAEVKRSEFANTADWSKKIYDIHEKVKLVLEGKSPEAAGLSKAEWAKYNPKGPNAQNSVWLGQRTYYERNKHIHSKGRMLSHDLRVNSVGISFRQDPRASYKIRFAGGVVEGVKIRRSVRLMRGGTHGGKHGIVFASFPVSGTIDKSSVHEVQFKFSFSPSEVQSKLSTRVNILEDKRGGPGFEQMYKHYKPIEPGVPKDTIFAKWVELEGPYYDDKSALELIIDKYKMAKRIIKKDNEKLDITARKFLNSFAEKAFRDRDVPADFIEHLHSYYKVKRAAGLDFKDAIIDPMAMILTSTRFLYLLEPSADQSVKKLDAFSLANRLSYFLWSSPPDDELYELVGNGEILKPEILKQQVDRMLTSPKAETFFKGFMAQWIHLKRFEELGLSSRLLLHRTDGMMDSTRREPIEFFKTLVRENLCSSNLIDSDFVVVNGVLAMKYGLEFKHLGNEFQKVKLPKKSPRGGLMTQAAFLSMGTMGNRTSPVIRGAMVKEILLNDPPPPPPPNVPELVHKGVDPLSSVRKLVELHQQKAQCASCHARFDFIGLGLENFGPVGVWRNTELVTLAEEAPQIKKNPKKVYKVEASGKLPDGTSFKDIFGLKKALMKQKSKAAASLLEGLFCYALGRDISFTDRLFIEETLDKLANRNSGAEYPVKEMITEVVTSKYFMEN